MYKCDFCSRTYTLKKYYTKHFAICKEYHKIQTEKDVDRIDYEPTPKELYALIKELTYKCSELEKEVCKLKKTTYTRTRTHIVDWLNENKTIELSFTKWYSSMKIQHSNLELVFERDLNEGIKDVIEQNIENTNTTNIPICCFSKKLNQFYIYEYDENSKTNLIWRKITKRDFEQMLFHISHKLMQVFIKWQNENKEKINNNEKMKQDEINCMIKINCSISSIDKRVDKIKKWLFPKIQDEISITHIEFG